MSRAVSEPGVPTRRCCGMRGGHSLEARVSQPELALADRIGT